MNDILKMFAIMGVLVVLGMAIAYLVYPEAFTIHYANQTSNWSTPRELTHAQHPNCITWANISEGQYIYEKCIEE